MTDLSLSLARGENLAEPGDYFELLKPRVMSLVVFTALAGMLAASAPINPVIGLVSLLAIAVGAGGSGALNMWYDADIDVVMARTRGRPIPTGRIPARDALALGLILSAFSVATLGLAANWVAAGLLAFTIFFYVVVYTMWLKRWTPQNIVIGGAAGAFPPMVAWAAVTGTVSLESVVLFAIIFLWTPPHFWALALYKEREFAEACIPMMPNVKGADRTRLEILLYTLVLVPVTLLPAALGFAHIVYLAVAAVTGALTILLAARVYRIRSGDRATTAAKQLFAFSILHLFLLFAVVVADGIATRFG